MKRSSQGPPSKAPAGSSKMKDMQKAYGVTSKASSTSTTKSVKKSSGTASEKVAAGSMQKSRSSLGNGVKTSSSTAMSDAGSSISTSTTRRSYPSEKNSSSKILAASKANYAEKYGAATGSGGASSSGVKTTKSLGSVGSNSSHRKSNSNNNNSPYTLSPQKLATASRKSSVSSVASLITNQKPPQTLYESEAPDDYDEDFEEEYESDFEEGNSTEEDSEKLSQKQNGTVVKEDSVSRAEDDLDRSSSTREFEKLERMVMVEVAQMHDFEMPKEMTYDQDVKTNGGGSGEPAATIAKHSEGVEEESESEEESEEEESGLSEESPPDVKKQNAFPITSGFSISTSLQNEQGAQDRQRKGSVRYLEEESGENSVKTLLKGPGHETEKQKMKRANRGKIIQGMIKLDKVGVDIFHLVPYPYERFMAVFSGSDRLQTSTQTDVDKCAESVQTEPIEQTTKWTQKPPTWSTTSSSCDIRIVRQEALGVGSDDVTEDLSPDQKIYKQFEFLKNWEQLSKFIIRSSRKMLYVLEAEERIKLPATSGKKGSLETIKMNRGLSVLSKLEMHTLAGDGECVGCANGTPFHPLLDDNKENKTTNGNKKTSKNLITVWSLKEPSMPLYFLRVWGHVSALKVHMIGRMIISGSRDGSLNVWNLDEPLCYHSQYQEQVIRTPSVNTSCMIPTHVFPIVGIEMFSDTKNTFSIVSIDKEGLIITWSCHRSQDALGESSTSQYSSAWSTVHMSVRHQIQLDEITKDHLQLTCFSAYLDTEGSTTGFYFGTFNGYVAKGQVVDDGSGNGKAGNVTASIVKYHERVDSNPKVTCMDVSAALNILAMGCEDGRCRLFEMSRKKLVLSLGGKQEPLRVKWSGRRASVLYVALKDSLLVWDLLTSDMNPWKTIHLKDIRDFVLYSPPHKEYLVIITGNDLIISTPAEEVRPLSSRDSTRIQSYFSLLC